MFPFRPYTTAICVSVQFKFKFKFNGVHVFWKHARFCSAGGRFVRSRGCGCPARPRAARRGGNCVHDVGSTPNACSARAARVLRDLSVVWRARIRVVLAVSDKVDCALSFGPGVLFALGLVRSLPSHFPGPFSVPWAAYSESAARPVLFPTRSVGRAATGRGQPPPTGRPEAHGGPDRAPSCEVARPGRFGRATRAVRWTSGPGPLRVPLRTVYVDFVGRRCRSRAARRRRRHVWHAPPLCISRLRSRDHCLTRMQPLVASRPRVGREDRLAGLVATHPRVASWPRVGREGRLAGLVATWARDLCARCGQRREWPRAPAWGARNAPAHHEANYATGRRFLPWPGAPPLVAGTASTARGCGFCALCGRNAALDNDTARGGRIASPGPRPRRQTTRLLFVSFVVCWPPQPSHLYATRAAPWSFAIIGAVGDLETATLGVHFST